MKKGVLFGHDDDEQTQNIKPKRNNNEDDDDDDVLLLLPLTNSANVCEALSDASSYAHKQLSLPSTVRLRDVYVQARADRAWPASHTRPDAHSRSAHVEVQLGAVVCALSASHAAVAVQSSQSVQILSALTLCVVDKLTVALTGVAPRSVLKALRSATAAAKLYPKAHAHRRVCFAAGMRRVLGDAVGRLGSDLIDQLVEMFDVCTHVVFLGHGAWCLASRDGKRVAALVALPTSFECVRSDLAAHAAGQRYAGSVADAFAAHSPPPQSPPQLNTAERQTRTQLQVLTVDLSSMADMFDKSSTRLLPSEVRSWVPRALNQSKIPCVVRTPIMLDGMTSQSPITDVDVLVVICSTAIVQGSNTALSIGTLQSRFGATHPPLVVLLMPQWQRIAPLFHGEAAVLGIDTYEITCDAQASMLASVERTFNEAYRLVSIGPNPLVKMRTSSVRLSGDDVNGLAIDSNFDARLDPDLRAALGSMMQFDKSFDSTKAVQNDSMLMDRRLARWTARIVVQLLASFLARLLGPDTLLVSMALDMARRDVLDNWHKRRVRCEDEIPIWLLCDSTTPDAVVGLPIVPPTTETATQLFSESIPPQLRCFDLVHFGVNARMVSRTSWLTDDVDSALFIARVMIDLRVVHSLDWRSVSEINRATDGGGGGDKSQVVVVDAQYAALDKCASTIPALIVVVVDINGTPYETPPLRKVPSLRAALVREPYVGRRVATNVELETFCLCHVMFLGDAGVGKSTSVRGLAAMSQRGGIGDGSTEVRSVSGDGICVTRVAAELRVHIWDFGGRAFSTTHEMFTPMCGVAAFVVVASLAELLGDRYQAANESLRTWLRSAVSAGGGHCSSAVILVLTHCGESGTFAFDSLQTFAREVLAKRHPERANEFLKTIDDDSSGVCAMVTCVIGLVVNGAIFSGFEPLRRALLACRRTWTTVVPAGFSQKCSEFDQAQATGSAQPMTLADFEHKFGVNAKNWLRLSIWHGTLLAAEGFVFVDPNWLFEFLRRMTVSVRTPATALIKSDAATIEIAIRDALTGVAAATEDLEWRLRSFGLHRGAPLAEVQSPALIMTTNADTRVIEWCNGNAPAPDDFPVVAYDGSAFFAVTCSTNAAQRVRRHIKLFTDGLLYTEDVLADHCWRTLSKQSGVNAPAEQTKLCVRQLDRFELGVEQGAGADRYLIVTSLLPTFRHALLDDAPGTPGCGVAVVDEEEREKVFELVAKLRAPTVPQPASVPTVSLVFEFDPPLPSNFVKRVLDRIHAASVKAVDVKHALATGFQFVVGRVGKLSVPLERESNTAIAVCFADAFALDTATSDEQIWLQLTPNGLRCDMWWHPTELALNFRSGWVLDVVTLTMRDWTTQQDQLAAQQFIDDRRSRIPIDDKATLKLSMPWNAEPRPAREMLADPKYAPLLGTMITPRSVGVSERSHERGRIRVLLPKLIDTMHDRVANGPIMTPVWSAHVPPEQHDAVRNEFCKWISLLQREALYLCGHSPSGAPRIIVIDLAPETLTRVEAAFAREVKDCSKPRDICALLTQALGDGSGVSVRFVDETPGDWCLLDVDGQLGGGDAKEQLGILHCTRSQAEAVARYLFEWNDLIWHHAFALLYTSGFWRQDAPRDSPTRVTYEAACRFAKLCNLLLLNKLESLVHFAHDWRHAMERLLSEVGIDADVRQKVRVIAGPQSEPPKEALLVRQLDTGEWFLGRLDRTRSDNILLAARVVEVAPVKPGSIGATSSKRSANGIASMTVDTLVERQKSVSAPPGGMPLPAAMAQAIMASSDRPPLLVQGAVRPKWCFIPIVGGEYRSLAALSGNQRSAEGVARYFYYKTGAVPFQCIKAADLTTVDNEFKRRLDALDTSVQSAVVYLSGHGRSLGDTFAMFLENSDGYYTQLFDVRMLLLILLECSKLSQIFLIVDSCSSGSATQLAGLKLGENRSVFVMTSSMPNQSSFEVVAPSGNRFSLFSGALCMALEVWAAEATRSMSAFGIYEKLTGVFQQAVENEVTLPEGYKINPMTATGSPLSMKGYDAAPTDGADPNFEAWRADLVGYFRI